MIHVKFYLRQPKGIFETPIVLRMFLGGRRLKYSTEIKITPDCWDKQKQRVKPLKKATYHLEQNFFLDLLRTSTTRIYWDFVNNNNGEEPGLNFIRDELDKKLQRKKTANRQTLMSFIKQMIEHSKTGVRMNIQTGKPLSLSTIKTYTTTLHHLQDFQKHIRRTVDFDDVNLDFYNSFSEFLIKECKLSTNTVGKDIQVFKLIMNEAVDLGHTKNIAHRSKRFITIREESESIYLDKDELQELEKLDLSTEPKLERVRDLFLVGCFTGLRFSDYSVLQPSHIRNGFITMKQTKTTFPVTIPVHETVKRIIQKYHGFLPRAVSNQKMNGFLKEIGKRVKCLEVKGTKNFTKEGRRQQREYEKWELMTTHTARRSFATNEYLAGTPTLTIMAITGHKTEKAFLKYIKLTSAEHAKLLQTHWEKRNSIFESTLQPIASAMSTVI